MTRARRRRAAMFSAGLAGVCLLTGCASPGAGGPQSPAAAVTSPLDTTLTVAGGQTWAVVVVDGSAASQDSFWELFARPAASTRWKLVTPPGVASNGGLVAPAPAAGQRLDIAFRPSQGLTFSPLARTGDGGKTWGTGLSESNRLAAGTVSGVLASREALAATIGPCSGDEAALIERATRKAERLAAQLLSQVSHPGQPGERGRHGACWAAAGTFGASPRVS